MKPEDFPFLLDDALYEPDAVKRDFARGVLAREANEAQLCEILALLDAPQRMTRRRAARILSETEPDRVRDVLTEALLDLSKPVRVRSESARIVSMLSDCEEALAAGLKDPDPHVRRACASQAAPVEALKAALLDVETGERAAESLDLRAVQLTEEEAWPVAEAWSKQRTWDPALARLLARSCPRHPAVRARALSDAALLDDWEDKEALLDILNEPPLPNGSEGESEQRARRLASAVTLSRMGVDLSAWAGDDDAKLRAVVAKSLDPASDLLDKLVNDPDPGVRWLAERTRLGAYTREAQDRIKGRHARLDSPSARPPYGIHERDLENLTLPPRRHAALALCHTRFDINLGVAVRSAEAAGLEEVFILGKEEIFKSPLRGTDLVLKLTHVQSPAELLRLARQRGYQLVAVQQTPNSEPYLTANYPPCPLFVMGAEDLGVPPELRAGADLAVEIPMFGLIDSLNVAAAATTVMLTWASMTASSAK